MSFFRWLSVSSSLIFTLALALTTPKEAVGAAPSWLTVKTAQGFVRGFVDGDQITFRNIPFAAPPVEKLRWRPTKQPKSWSGVRDGTQWGPMCPQFGDDGHGNWTPVGSEDCLNLNVHVPSDTAPSSGLPVMVYLFPGENIEGNNREDLSFLVSRGVIVVNPNYRLGVLGWMGHPLLTREGLGTSPNYGMYDQVEALRWVKQNIQAFGGDPNNVTLFGGSAGAFDATGQLANPLAKGLITKIILESPVQFPKRLHDTEYAGAVIALNAGCGPTTGDVMECLRDLSWIQLESAYEQFVAGPYNLLELWPGFDTPTVDGITVVDQPLTYVEQYGSVPMLVGYNRDEQAFVLLPDPLQPVAATQREFASVMYSWIVPPWDPFDKAVYRSLQALYPLVGQRHPAPLTPPYQSVNRAFVDLITDQSTGGYSRSLARAAAQYGGQQTSVYRWVFAHTLEVPASSPDYTFYQALGAYHLSQEGFYSNFHTTFFFPAGYHPTAAERLLARQMADYWTNFAKRSDPNGNSVPHWPRFFEGSDQIQILDDPILSSVKFHSFEQDLALQLYLEAPYGPYLTSFPWSVFPCTDLGDCQNLLPWYLTNIGPAPPDPYKAGW